MYLLLFTKSSAHVSDIVPVFFLVLFIYHVMLDK